MGRAIHGEVDTRQLEGFRELVPHAFHAVEAMVAAEASPVGLVLASLSGQILYANPAFRALCGSREADAVPDAGLHELALPGIDEASLARLARVGEPQQFELRSPRGAPEARWWCHACRQPGWGGEPRWLVLTFTEIGLTPASGAAGD